MRTRARLVWGLVPVLTWGACDGQRQELLEARRAHGQRIQQVAALRPYLELAAPAGQAAAAREAALLARAEIVKRAQGAGAYREQAGPRERSRPLRSAERLAHSFEAVVGPCAVRADEPPQEQAARAVDCRRSLEGLDGALAIEDRLAMRHGLPPGTIPQLGVAAANTGQAAAAPLVELVTPAPGEALRRRLWQDERATAEQLGTACAAALRETQQRKSQAVAQEVGALCRTLEEIAHYLGVFAQCRADQGPACPGPGPCGGLRTLQQRPGAVPAALSGQVDGVVQACAERLQQLAAPVPPG